MGNSEQRVTYGQWSTASLIPAVLSLGSLTLGLIAAGIWLVLGLLLRREPPKKPKPGWYDFWAGGDDW